MAWTPTRWGVWIGQVQEALTIYSCTTLDTQVILSSYTPLIPRFCG
jgi:hypothetical protein